MNFLHEKEVLITINTSQTMNYCMLSKSIKAKITNNKKSSLKIKKELKESKLKEIKKNLYQIENKKGLLE